MNKKYILTEMDTINNLTNNSCTVSFNLLSSSDLIIIISILVIVHVIILAGTKAVVFLYRFFQQKSKKVVQKSAVGVDAKIKKNIDVPTNLLGLPILVVENILGYLDSKSLRILRRVSQKTKSWIDRPRYLRKIPIYINNKYQTEIEKITNSNIEWSNINVIGKERFMDIIIPFLQNFRSSIKILNIEISIGPSRLFTILRHVSPSLESLGFYLNIVSIPANFNDELCETLKKNLIGLKNLNMNYIRTFSTSGNERINLEHFLEQLFNVCQNLHVIRFPELQSLQGQLPVEWFFRPIISYLRAATVLCIRRSLKKIYFPKVYLDTFSKRLFDSEIVSHIWRSSTMRELVMLCEPLGVKLFNIPCIYLPNFVDLTEYEILCLNKCVKCIVSISSNIGICSNMYIPSGCEIHIAVFVTSATNHSNFELGENLNITMIYLTSKLTTECITNTPNIFNKLLQTFRPTLHSLVLNGNSCFAELKLSPYFPNLQELWIRGYNKLNLEPLEYMMDGLEQLETLNCYKMSPTFIAANKDQLNFFFKLSFSKFKKLAHIRIPFTGPSNIELNRTGNMQI